MTIGSQVVGVVCGLAAYAAIGEPASARVEQVPATQQQRGARPQQPPAIDLVEVVGCLSEEPGGTWMLHNASQPARTTTQMASAESLKAAAKKRLGGLRFHLIGVSVFNPGAHNGHRMAVKGALIKATPDARVNVTSLQMLAPTCPS